MADPIRKAGRTTFEAQGFRRSLPLLLALALAPLPACTSGGSGSGGSGAASGAAGSGAGSGPGGSSGAADGPFLVSARLVDADASGDASRGDALLLGFDRDTDASALSLAALRLLSAQDSLGAGASVLQTGPREVTVPLGTGASLSLYDTYDPRPGPNRSPAAISVDAGGARSLSGAPSQAGRPVPITLPFPERRRFQPDQHRGAFQAFLGQMHAHTSWSDGSTGVPADAFAMARTRGGLDWFTVTDHLEFLPVQPWKWPLKKQQAEAATVDGAFVAMWGYEWGHGIANPLGPAMYNHINVLADDLVDLAKTATLDGLYAEVAKLPGGPIGKFNHPAKPDKAIKYGVTLTFENWDQYRYNGAADRHFRFVRVMQGMHDDAIGYIPFLDNGWHLAPGFGEDNHGPDWGLSECRMGVYTTALTRADIQDGMRARRSFTTSDRDAWVRVLADDPAGPVWMGSTLVGPGAVTLRVEAGDPSDGMATLEVVSQGGSVIVSQALGGAHAIDAPIVIDPTDDAYAYIRITEDDGDLIYSAPIFIDR